MKRFLLIALLFSCASLLFGQDAADSKSQIQVNSLLELNVNGNRLGLQAEYNRPVFQNKSNRYLLSAGIMNELFIKDESDIAGTSGSTLSNTLGLTLTNSFFILNNRKVFVANTIYAGWGHRSTSASYVNPTYDIDKDYQSSFSYFALGAYWKLGYFLKDNFGLQFIGKTDFSRLIDQYEPTIFERPGFMYGVGVVVNF
jgi:hypothetical protein